MMRTQTILAKYANNPRVRFVLNDAGWFDWVVGGDLYSGWHPKNDADPEADQTAEVICERINGKLAQFYIRTPQGDISNVERWLSERLATVTAERDAANERVRMMSAKLAAARKALA